MDDNRFDGLTRFLGGGATRRGAVALLAGVAGATLAAGEAKKKKKKKPCKDCCLENGNACTTGAACKSANCLKTPFTVQAKWGSTKKHFSWVLLPHFAGQDLPYIDSDCNPGNSSCEDDRYPFICVDKTIAGPAGAGPGDEVATVRKLVADTYQYWVQLDPSSASGDVTVTLRRSNGGIVRSWSSPANASTSEIAEWHVFDIDGKTGSIALIDRLMSSGPGPWDDICPGR